MATSHVSFSQLKSYTRCSWQYRLERIDHVPQQPSWALVGGKAFHYAVESMLRNGETTKGAAWVHGWSKSVAETRQHSDVPMELWRAAGRATKDKPNGEDGTWWESAGAQMLDDWVKWLETMCPPWRVALFDETFAIELDLSAAIGGSTVKAYADAVLTNGTDFAVVDWKTGSRKQPSEQLGLYAVLMERLGLPRPKVGMYYMARKGEATPCGLSGYTEDYFAPMFAALDEAKSRDIYIPNIGDHCGGCSVREHCAAYQVVSA